MVSSQLALTVNQLVILVVMGAVQLGLPYFLFSKGLQSVSLQEASLIALIEPVLNPIWVALMVGEIPSAATVSGGAMILFGLGVRYLWPLLENAADNEELVTGEFAYSEIRTLPGWRIFSISSRGSVLMSLRSS